MFTIESTENLLDNLEYELSEVIQLERPRSREVKATRDNNLPIPTKRNAREEEEIQLDNFPVAAPRKLDKNGKNDENEIIQLSTSIASDLIQSLSSSSLSEIKSSKVQTVIAANSEMRGKKVTTAVVEVHEKDDQDESETTFVVTKHAKIERKEHEKVVQVQQKLAPPSHTQNISSATSKSDTTTELSSEDEKPQEAKPKKIKKRETPKKKKAKKKKRQQSSIEDESDSLSTEKSSSREVADKNEEPQTIGTGEIGIFLSSTGPLTFSINLKNLIVKVSVFNEDNGKQIGDSVVSEAGTFNNEFHNLICTWNEMLIINQDLNRLKEIYSNVLVFFELINSAETAVCWAFMKLFTSACTNTGSFQLQLFQYHQRSSRYFLPFFRRDETKLDWTIYQQWQLQRRKFSGILNVNIKAMKHHKVELLQEEPKAVATKLLALPVNSKWRKLPGQACKVPEKVTQKLQFREKGSMLVKFSPDGHFLVFTEVTTRHGHILHINKFPEMAKVFMMTEHSDLIHDIDFLRQKTGSEGHLRMVTASSDFTAIVWYLKASEYTFTILPHPSFVYASKFLQTDDAEKARVVTAGRDSIVRIWRAKAKQEVFELAQELKPQKRNKNDYITSITTRNAETFYTSNSVGDVIEWTLQKNGDYHLNRHFTLSEIHGRIVTNMDLHPRGNKIYLHARDYQNDSGMIFVVGIPTGLITQRFQQQRSDVQSQLKVSPCGTFLFSSHYGIIKCHQLVNGNLSTSIGNDEEINLRINDRNFISSMDYHPKDFYLACAVYGAESGGIFISSVDADNEMVDKMEKWKIGSLDAIERIHEQTLKASNFTDIIRRLDEVFLMPADQKLSLPLKEPVEVDDNTFTVESKRSKTFTVSQQGPATYTIPKNNNTYEIQRNEESEDETTISESLN